MTEKDINPTTNPTLREKIDLPNSDKLTLTSVENDEDGITVQSYLHINQKIYGCIWLTTVTGRYNWALWGSLSRGACNDIETAIKSLFAAYEKAHK